MSRAKHNRSVARPFASNPFESQQTRLELCEKRLALAAQFVCEPLLAQALQSPQPVIENPGLQSDLAPAIELHDLIQPVLPHSDTSAPIQPHLSEAHQATGWATARDQFGLSGSGQTVAVIDSGIAWDHVSLGGGIGPGYRVVGGWDFTEENDAQPYDDGPAGFHGSHVAGIIGSDNVQHPGVASEVDLVALRVFNDRGQGQLAWVEQALAWVYENRNTFEHPITTVNLSLGSSWNADTVPSWGTLENELQQLSNAGIVVIASAGNSFEQYNAPGVSYPAASPYVLPVASVGNDGLLSDFSQRNRNVLAAPGENIVSTVPDYYYGRDGRLNDFATASGTSMAAPYVAGAAVVVREAMEMVGFSSINLATIADHLRATADSVYDALTGASYPSLNLARAIDALIPDDVVSDSSAAASNIQVGSDFSGWINSVTDRDVYRFTPAANGVLQLDADSNWASQLQWTITSNGQQIAAGATQAQTLTLQAGTTYELNIASPGAIGAFTMNMDFVPNSSGGSGGESVPNAENLGAIDYRSGTVQAGSAYRAQAVRDGIFSVQWSNPDAASGVLNVEVNQRAFTDSTWTGGQLRLDLDVRAGDWISIALPGRSGDEGRLDLANVIQVSGATLCLLATSEPDALRLSLNHGITLGIDQIEYSYPSNAFSQISIHGSTNNDSLSLLGSNQSDKVDLAPDGATLTNSGLAVSILGVEEVSFAGGGGADRVYLYDSNTADTLTARPREATLQGVGYRFDVTNVDRLFMHATGDGEDIAYLYDSTGNDALSVRPQFTSMSGEGFFNYVRGFERVYAYSNAGGNDVADIYDSSSDDRFVTSGTAASIFGPGFASYTRGFDRVVGYATAGGNDSALVYASDSRAEWLVGVDYVRVNDQGWHREARGFDNVQPFVAGEQQNVSSLGWGLSGNSMASASETTEQDSQSSMLMQTSIAAHIVLNAWHAPELNDRSALEGATDVDHDALSNPIDAATSANFIHGLVNGQGNALPIAQDHRDEQNGTGWSDWIAADEDPDSTVVLNDPRVEYSVLDQIFRSHG